MAPMGDLPARNGARAAHRLLPTLGYARVEAAVAETVGKTVDRLCDVFPRIDQVDEVCPDHGEILAAEFIGGCSARLGDAIDNTLS
jgi:hypothetical protein